MKKSYIKVIFHIASFIFILSMLYLLTIEVKANDHDEPPKITTVRLSPDLSIYENWVNLPKGEGNVKIIVTALNTEKMRFWITPTGTDTWKYRKLLGEDNEKTDGWSIIWNYKEKDYLDHIVIEAVGPGGTDIFIFNVIKQESFLIH